MKVYFILILATVSMISCNTSVKNEKLKNSKILDEKSTVKSISNSSSLQATITTFQEYINFMATVQLPLMITCNNPYFPTYEMYRNNEYGANFKPDGATIIGKLQSNDKFAAIIYSYPADISLPILETYNISGAKIDELQLLNYPRCINDVDSIETNSSLVILSLIHI